jgi:hypothetical protein
MIPPGSYGSAITIVEVTGTRGWSITLVGAGLPHQGAGWGIENRVPTDFYPGNFAQGTQQVIGPKEGPSHWSGKWTRTLLVRSPAIITPDGQAVATTTPSTLADFFEQLVLGGARLRVTWTATKTESSNGVSTPSSYQVVREGRANKLAFVPLTADDIRWEVDWRWVGRGGTQQKAVSARDSDASSAATAVQSAITDAQSAIGAFAPYAAADPLVAYSADAFSLGTYETLSPGFSTLSSGLGTSFTTLRAEFSTSVNVGRASSTASVQSTGSLLSVCVDTVSTVNAFTDQAGEMPFEAMTTSDQASDLAYAADVAATQVLQAWVVAQAAQRAAQKARLLVSANPGGGQKGSQQTSGTSAGQMLGTYTTRAGDTPLSVARLWYGNPDRAQSLLRANHLSLGLPTFVPGTVLMVPILGSSVST